MLTVEQKRHLSELVSGIRTALKKGTAIRKDFEACQTHVALTGLKDALHKELDDTIEDKEVKARSKALVSTIYSQVRSAKGFPKDRKDGAGRKAKDKPDAGEPDADKGLVAAVAYIVKRHAEVPDKRLAVILLPLADIIRKAYAEKK